MSQGLSRNDLFQFLEYLREKGLMNPQTASARKASASSLLGILSDEEAGDVTKLNLDHVTQRFLNLKGTDFKPESVKVYKSRTESAIKDFVAYKKDPLGFKPGVEQRAPRNGEQKGKSMRSENARPASQSSAPAQDFQTEGMIFPIPLRPTVTVKIAGIPSDLTQAEARKISNVIIALALSEEL